MGEGNFQRTLGFVAVSEPKIEIDFLATAPSGAVTRQCDPFDAIDPADDLARRDAWDAFVANLRGTLSEAWHPVTRAWRCRNARILARSGLHEVTVYENSYGTVFVTLWSRDDLDHGCEALARATLARTAEGIFARLSHLHDLRIATSAWTSARWVPLAKPPTSSPSRRGDRP